MKRRKKTPARRKRVKLYRKYSPIPKSAEQKSLERAENRGEFRYAVRVTMTRPRRALDGKGPSRYKKLRNEIFQTKIKHHKILITRHAAYFRTVDEVDRFLRREKSAFLKSGMVTVDATVQLVHGRVINKFRARLARGAMATKQYRAYGVSKVTKDKRTHKFKKRKKRDIATEVQNAFTDVADEVYTLREDGFSTITHEKVIKVKEKRGEELEEKPERMPMEKRAELSRAKRAAEEKALLAEFRVKEPRVVIKKRRKK